MRLLHEGSYQNMCFVILEINIVDLHMVLFMVIKRIEEHGKKISHQNQKIGKGMCTGAKNIRKKSMKKKFSRLYKLIVTTHGEQKLPGVSIRSYLGYTCGGYQDIT